MIGKWIGKSPKRWLKLELYDSTYYYCQNEALFFICFIGKRICIIVVHFCKYMGETYVMRVARAGKTGTRHDPLRPATRLS
jgi:hypothetical protein